MPIWDKLKTELDRAGKAAAQAIDEGKFRLEAFRARQLADKAAQSLGYAIFRARESGQDLDSETYARLAQVLREREGEVKRLEEQLRAAGGGTTASTPADATADAPAEVTVDAPVASPDRGTDEANPSPS